MSKSSWKPSEKNTFQIIRSEWKLVKRFDDLTTVVNQPKHDTLIQVTECKSDFRLGGFEVNLLLTELKKKLCLRIAGSLERAERGMNLKDLEMAIWVSDELDFSYKSW